MLIPDEHPVLKIEKIPSLFEIPDHLLCYQLREGCCLSASWTNTYTQWVTRSVWVRVRVRRTENNKQQRHLYVQWMGKTVKICC